MNKKKILSAVIAGALLAASVPASAADGGIIIDEPVISGNIITLTGSVPAPGARIYVEIARKGSELTDPDNVYAARQVTADGSGKFEIICEMPDSDRAAPENKIDGYFTAYAFSAGFEADDIDFSYVNEDSRSDFFEALNTAAGSPGTMTSFLDDPDNKLILDTYNIFTDEYNSFSAEIRQKAGEVIALSDIDFTEDNIGLINETIIAMRLNALKSAEEAAALLETDDIKTRCELSCEDVTYENAEESLKDSFIEAVLENASNCGFSQVSDLDALFDDIFVLHKVNNTHYSKLYDVLAEYKQELRLDESDVFSDIESLSTANKERVMNELKKLSNNITSVDQLHSLIERAYENYENDRKGNGGSSGGSGGGGGGGSNTSVSSPVISGAIKEPEATEKPEDVPVQTEDYFDDLDGFDWAKDAVNALAAAGVIAGDGAGNFEPQRNVTRAEFLRMLLSALDLVDERAQCSFDDVSSGDWCYPYVASAYQAGITSGIDENVFGKDELITRQEAAVFMHRAAVRVYLPLENASAEAFADEADIDEWAKRSVNIMRSASLINGVGDNMFMPKANATRAEAAKMVYGIYELML